MRDTNHGGLCSRVVTAGETAFGPAGDKSTVGCADYGPRKSKRQNVEWHVQFVPGPRNGAHRRKPELVEAVLPRAASQFHKDAMSEKIKPHGDNVVVEIVAAERSAGGIIIPDKAKSNQRDAIIGKVLAVGKGRVTEYGATVKPEAEVGDYVLLARGAGVEIELDTRSKDKRRVRILRDCELLGTVEESRIIQLGLVPK